QLEGSLVEMDESYFGAKRKRGNKRGRPSPNDTSKTCVVGIAERSGKGRVYATVADDATRKTLHGIAKERIMPETTIFTDEYYSYNGLDQQGYTHRRINHTAGVYVMGDVHTNTIEGFWGLVKRGIGGVYHQVSRKYLQSYLNEYAYRYNRRDRGNLIFTSILQRACGRAC
ncbi:MAG: IS1595 family transposase, partial [Acidobacteriales bacterium]|nr:IS1595 family transposase [Terriglobales bacterium]